MGGRREKLMRQPSPMRAAASSRMPAHLSVAAPMGVLALAALPDFSITSSLLLLGGVLLLILAEAAFLAWRKTRCSAPSITKPAQVSSPSEAIPASAPSAPAPSTDPVAFTAYYPKEVVRDKWAPLLVFAAQDQEELREQVTV